MTAPYPGSCTFCVSPAPEKYALTVCSGDPEVFESWRREALPVCPVCHRRLRRAGLDGITKSGSGGRWWLGYGSGGPAKILRERLP